MLGYCEKGFDTSNAVAVETVGSWEELVSSLGATHSWSAGKNSRIHPKQNQVTTRQPPWTGRQGLITAVTYIPGSLA